MFHIPMSNPFFEVMSPFSRPFQTHKNFRRRFVDPFSKEGVVEGTRFPPWPHGPGVGIVPAQHQDGLIEGLADRPLLSLCVFFAASGSLTLKPHINQPQLKKQGGGPPQK